MQLAGGQVILEVIQVIMLMLFKSPTDIKVLKLQKCTAENPICQTVQISALSGEWPSRSSMPLGLLFKIKLNKCLYPCDTWTGYQLSMETTLISSRKSIAAFKRFKGIHLLNKIAVYCSVRFYFLVVLTKTLPHRPDIPFCKVSQHALLLFWIEPPCSVFCALLRWRLARPWRTHWWQYAG